MLNLTIVGVVLLLTWLIHFENVVRPSGKNKQGVCPEGNRMNIGDKVIAVGVGRKTKELNGGDIVRSRGRGGFGTLALEQVVMTITEIDGEAVSTKFYQFHKDDLHLVDSGRASVAIPEVTPEPTVRLSAGEYTRGMLEAKLDELN